MDKVKALLRAGVSVSAAIRAALGVTLVDFAEKHGLNRAMVTDQVNGARRPSGDLVTALIADLGGTDEEWRALLWIAGKPGRVPDEFAPLVSESAA
jgi:plasmid maintenance system antidote protein VapI